jgi:hypothetical protein
LAARASSVRSARRRPACRTTRAWRIRQSGGVRRAGARALGQRQPQLDHRSVHLHAERRRDPDVPRQQPPQLDWRLDATNLLNRVTYASVNTLVTSPQFGLPNRANDMRKLRATHQGAILSCGALVVIGLARA